MDALTTTWSDEIRYSRCIRGQRKKEKAEPSSQLGAENGALELSSWTEGNYACEDIRTPLQLVTVAIETIQTNTLPGSSSQ